MGAAHGGGAAARPGLWNRAMGRASRTSGVPGGFQRLGGLRDAPQGRLLGGSWSAPASWRHGALLLGGCGALLYLLLLAQAALLGPQGGHVRSPPPTTIQPQSPITATATPPGPLGPPPTITAKSC